MAPPFRPPKPKGPVRPQFDAKRDLATDPARLAYEITPEAASALVVVHRLGGKSPKKLVNGYVARHLVEKGLLIRLPGRDTSYRLTLRGEAVIEMLRGRKSLTHLFDFEKEQQKPIEE